MNEPVIPDDEISLRALIEALLFVAPGSVTPAQLADALQVSIQDIERGLDELEANYVQLDYERGIRLQKHRGRVQLTSAPQASVAIERLLGLEETGNLSRAALEALAVILYKQPVTRPQIDEIRGVNSDGVLRTLLSKGLIQEVGRAEGPGRPILYGITSDLLQYFGFNSLMELPPLKLDDDLATEPS